MGLVVTLIHTHLTMMIILPVVSDLAVIFTGIMHHLPLHNAVLLTNAQLVITNAVKHRQLSRKGRFRIIGYNNQLLRFITNIIIIIWKLYIIIILRRQRRTDARGCQVVHSPNYETDTCSWGRVVCQSRPSYAGSVPCTHRMDRAATMNE